MNLLKRPASVQIDLVSGTLRVTVRPVPHWFLLLVEAGAIALLAAFSFRARTEMSLLKRILSTAAVVGAIAAWLEQLFGFEEVIEFDQRHLRIRKATFGWERTREYPIEQCTDLAVQDEALDPHGLQCRLGRWRTIEFGDYLTQQQAMEVLSALQDGFPEMAQKLLPSIDITRHFAKLDDLG
jgi:hypothetical protein